MVATTADEACRAIKMCSSDEIPKKYSKTCTRKSELPLLNPVENFVRHYIYKVADYNVEYCIIDLSKISFNTSYEDASCGYCEAGSVLTFSKDTYTC